MQFRDNAELLTWFIWDMSIKRLTTLRYPVKAASILELGTMTLARWRGLSAEQQSKWIKGMDATNGGWDKGRFE